MDQYVITFDSTECAMDASDALNAAGIHFRTLPTPLAISAGCGIALRIDADTVDVVHRAVSIIAVTECGAQTSGGAPLFAVYRKEDAGFTRIDSKDDHGDGR